MILTHCQSVLSLPSSRLYAAAAGNDGLFSYCFADTTTIPCGRLLKMMVVSLCGSRLHRCVWPCVAGNAGFYCVASRASTVACGRVLQMMLGLLWPCPCSCVWSCVEDDAGFTALFLILMFTLVAF